MACTAELRNAINKLGTGGSLSLSIKPLGEVNWSVLPAVYNQSVLC